jgi:hypothetical protein
MPQQPPPADKPPANKPPANKPPVSPLIVFALLLSAVTLAVLGTVLPGMLDFAGPERWMISGVFYLAAAGDVAIALWFRSKIRKGRAASGGTIQRQ